MLQLSGFSIRKFSNRKPWNYDSLHPLRHEYNRYLEFIPWRRRLSVWEVISNAVWRFSVCYLSI